MRPPACVPPMTRCIMAFTGVREVVRALEPEGVRHMYYREDLPPIMLHE